MDKISVEHLKNMSFEGHIDNFTVELDAKVEHGGQGLGMQPKPLMLVALAGCTAMDIASLSQKMRVELKRFTVDLAAEKSEEMPVVYTSAEISYNFEADETAADKIRKMVEMSQERYCGMVAMFRKICPLDYKIYLNGELM